MKKYFFYFVKILTCLSLNAFLFLASYIPLFARNYDWQLFIYLIFFILLIIGTWVLFFIRNEIYMKIVYIILFSVFINAYNFIPSVKQEFDFDSCVDMGICSEGTKFNDGIMNEKYCQKHNGKWNDERKECYFK